MSAADGLAQAWVAIVPNAEALLAQSDWVTFGRQSCLTAGEETGDLRHRQFVY